MPHALDLEIPTALAARRNRISCGRRNRRHPAVAPDDTVSVSRCLLLYPFVTQTA